MKSNEKIPRLIVFFFVIDFLLILLYLLNFGIGHPSKKLTSLLNIDGESSISTWYSAIQLFTIGVFFLIFASERIDQKNAQTWFIIIFPVIFLTMSLDEIAQIHEFFGRKSDLFLPGGNRKSSAFPISGIWMFLIGIPFFVLMIGLFYALRRYLDEKKLIFRKYILGLVIFCGSAAGIETLSNFVPYKKILYLILECMEELGEMVGATFILWATYDLLRFHNISLRIPPTTSKGS